MQTKHYKHHAPKLAERERITSASLSRTESNASKTTKALKTAYNGTKATQPGKRTNESTKAQHKRKNQATGQDESKRAPHNNIAPRTMP